MISWTKVGVVAGDGGDGSTEGEKGSVGAGERLDGAIPVFDDGEGVIIVVEVKGVGEGIIANKVEVGLGGYEDVNGEVVGANGVGDG